MRGTGLLMALAIAGGTTVASLKEGEQPPATGEVILSPLYAAGPEERACPVVLMSYSARLEPGRWSPETQIVVYFAGVPGPVPLAELPPPCED
jgi:hypothetical protein